MIQSYKREREREREILQENKKEFHKDEIDYLGETKRKENFTSPNNRADKVSIIKILI